MRERPVWQGVEPNLLQGFLRERLFAGCQNGRFAPVSPAHTHRLRVRYAECDMQGHVFNAHWLAYFDDAMTELWRARTGLGWQETTGRGIDMVVAEAQVSYRSPGRFDDWIDIEAATERLGTTSMTTALRATRDGELLVEGRLVHVFVDARTFAKTPIPDWVRAALVA
jgi:acyl-CoA thioester hydrolase